MCACAVGVHADNIGLREKLFYFFLHSLRAKSKRQEISRSAFRATCGDSKGITAHVTAHGTVCGVHDKRDCATAARRRKTARAAKEHAGIASAVNKEQPLLAGC